MSDGIAVPPTPKASWEDLLVRNTTTDTGQIPAEGGLSKSPDIIPHGKEPLGNPSTLIANMSSAPAQNIYSHESNYIYVRGVNHAPAKQSGKIHLYYCRASLLMFPRQWERNELPLNDKQMGSPVSAEAGGDFVTENPFFWQDVSPPPNGDHYCMVARVETQQNPNPIPEIFQLADFAKFIEGHRGYAWRNVAVVADPDTPTLEEQILYEQGDQQEEVHLMIECTNVTPGCFVAFNCGTKGPTPVIDLPKTKITQSSETLGIVTTIPAGFESDITFQYWANGKTQPENANFALRSIFIPPPTAEWEGIGVDPSVYGIPPERLPEGIGPVNATVLGSFNLTFQRT
jgi:hypothetical protein